MMQTNLFANRRSFFSFFSLVALLFSLPACLPEGLETMKQAYGRVDNILVVCESRLWNSPAGDSFRRAFSALYPVTPQPEPLYELRHVQPEELNKTLRTHRTIIFLADLSEKSAEGTQMVARAIGEEGLKRVISDPQYRIAVNNDRWAKGQLVVYWFSPNAQDLADNVAQHHKKVMQSIQKHDDKKLTEMVYSTGINQSATDSVKAKFKLEMSVPADYIVAKSDSQSLWLRFETEKISSSLFIYSFPNTQVPLTAEQFKSTRDSLTRLYFTTDIDSSFMQIDDRFLPVVCSPAILAGTQALQGRGVWSMVNDFMGGSFVGYLIDDVKNKRTIYVDGFVHAPGQQKRIELRRLDLILSTLKVL